MACLLAWSPEALEDVELIASFVERDSLWYAKIVASKIVSAAENIPSNPEMGRMVPEIADKNIRELFVYSYRLIYRIEPERIVVVAVIHGSRLLQPFVQRIESGI
ncbi:type II toxin-antitoxin system RelE/ParE family toxin [Pelodictyon phaeoclathratiforme]|jgi:plasmid stabilization system protein ParE|uniref:Plasmid stabilization system n=1 Tax=Pelodictyon phaeoclathratiforme (strain DSM 5477 / BU-1) TaxID=324925 RepID=B4SEN3_PELPB|nr:type II toxin-antitoxin system RelE/ParE family toxin [Pelodictyon phaeoclathratiforme]ACF43125.1 plasmid stabilization system [Pelodictyon phaeoclathratiforme BU-1]MBV5289929.1 type II toxin-antitoxin system RelE/ParE family toxin [Pelodictyon phaeoclathratiforme]